jgi:hypothetical protein
MVALRKQTPGGEPPAGGIAGVDAKTGSDFIATTAAVTPQPANTPLGRTPVGDDLVSQKDQIRRAGKDSLIWLVVFVALCGAAWFVASFFGTLPKPPA